jgi:dethiobiotin synthetase
MVIGTGNDSPCLDLRRLNTDLARRCQDVDLVVIEASGCLFGKVVA